MAMQQAVDHIAHRPAHDQADGQAEQPLARVAAQHPHDERRRHRTQADEEPALPAGSVGQKAEGRAGVVGPHQVEVAGDGEAVAQRQNHRTGTGRGCLQTNKQKANENTCHSAYIWI